MKWSMCERNDLSASVKGASSRRSDVRRAERYVRCASARVSGSRGTSLDGFRVPVVCVMLEWSDAKPGALPLVDEVPGREVGAEGEGDERTPSHRRKWSQCPFTTSP